MGFRRQPLSRVSRPGLACLPTLALLNMALSLHAAAPFNPATPLAGSGFTAIQDSVVTYQADSLFMEVEGRRTHLAGRSSLHFLGMALESPELLVDWERNRVEAWATGQEQAPETAPLEGGACEGGLELGAGQSLKGGASPRQTESLTPPTPESMEGDSLRLDPALPWPVFTDGNQVLYGRHMSLDIKTRQGFIRDGRAAEDPSFYGGTRVKRVAGKEMHVANAVFTTCDDDCPHYHFRARQLKMLVKDKVFAKDVTLHFGAVPTLYSPVALFSLKRGRASGMILPSYGQTEQQGRKLDHLGWYWAASDTWDTQMRLSYAENGPDWLFENLTRYQWRPGDKGQLAGSYNLTRTRDREGWDLRWSHDQVITPYMSFRAKVAMASSKQYYEENSDNAITRLTQNLTSNLSLAGSFPESGIRWTLNGSGTQNLETQQTTGSLPVLDLSFPTWSPLKSLGRSSTGASAMGDWLAGSTLKLSSRAESRYTMDGLDWAGAENRRGARHALNLSIPGKVGPLALTPSVSATSVWVDEVQDFTRKADGSLDSVLVGSFATRQTFSATVATSTQLYGVVYPKWGKLQALRHVLSPSLSATWTPDFSKEGWGYVKKASQGDSLVLKLDRFRNSIYGATPTRESLSLGMSLGQLWQSKWSAPVSALENRPDTLGTANATASSVKTDLLRLTTGASYNFMADSLRLSDFQSTWSLDPLQAAGLRLGPIGSLNMQMSTTHTPYQSHPTTGRKLARYLWQDGHLPRLTNTSITVSTRLGGGRGASTQAVAPIDDEDDTRFAPSFGSTDLGIPWTLSTTWSWSLDKSNPLTPIKRSLVDVRGSVNLSRNWKLSSGLHYDIEARSFSSQSLNLYRDMHCWEGHFTWDPRRGSYHLLIRVKSDLLEDLKWDKRKGRSGAFGSF